MKHINILLAILLLPLASCSEEEVLDSNKENVISFHAYVNNGSSTRGLEISTTTLDKFYVTALEQITTGEGSDATTSLIPFFTNTLFERKGTTDYVSATEFKWTNKMQLKFYAFAYKSPTNSLPEPGTEGSLFGKDVIINGTKQVIEDFSPQPKIEDQIDLIAATTEVLRPTALTAAVSLGFAHILNEVQIKAQCSTEKYNVSVKAIKYGNIKCKGTYNFDSRAWTLLPKDNNTPADEHVTTSYDVNYLDNPINLPRTEYIGLSKAEGTGSIGYAMLIPQGLLQFQTNQYWALGKDNAAPEGKSLATAQYMALLIKIVSTDAEKGTLFPQKNEHIVEGTDGYGWAYIPFWHNSYKAWGGGVRYIYLLDFKDGAGFNEDGDPILEGDVKIVAEVKDWVNKDDLYRPQQ